MGYSFCCWLLVSVRFTTNQHLQPCLFISCTHVQARVVRHHAINSRGATSDQIPTGQAMLAMPTTQHPCCCCCARKTTRTKMYQNKNTDRTASTTDDIRPYHVMYKMSCTCPDVRADVCTRSGSTMYKRGPTSDYNQLIILPAAAQVYHAMKNRKYQHHVQKD